MAKNTLPEDFKDDILAESMNGRRRYQMISNADGTVSFVDVTEYSQVGSNFGQAQINATNVAVNESADKNKIIDSKEDLLANTQAGMMAGALAVKEIRSELNENSNWKQLLLAENIPSSFTQYKVQWRGYKELLFAYGFYANVLETIIEPVFLFETHNGEGNRIVFGDSDEVEIYASLPNSDEAMFIKNSGRTTNLLRIYGR